MTWMASLSRDAGLALFSVPPSSSRVDATNTEDCPNLFSNFFSDVTATFSVSIPEFKLFQFRRQNYRSNRIITQGLEQRKKRNKMNPTTKIKCYEKLSGYYIKLSSTSSTQTNEESCRT